MDHGHEEIRNVAIDILAGRERSSYEPTNSDNLERGVAEVIERREGQGSRDRHNQPYLSVNDRQLFDEVFWDLFRQGIITPGINDSNRQFPHFRLSSFANASSKMKTRTSSTT